MLDTEKDGGKSDDVWLDLSEEDSCNWMMFVRPAQNHLEQNLVAYQYGSDIFYTTIKNIQPKQELKVGAVQTYFNPAESEACVSHGVHLFLAGLVCSIIRRVCKSKDP